MPSVSNSLLTLPGPLEVLAMLNNRPLSLKRLCLSKGPYDAHVEQKAHQNRRRKLT